MAKLTLTNLTSIIGAETTAIGNINANNAAVEAALENTLSRDGTSPNAMGADLDMNSNQILNLPEPSTNTEPLRYGDIDTFITIPNIFVQASEPSTSNPDDSLWIDSDSSQNDLYQLSGGSWVDTTLDLKGDTGDTGPPGPGSSDGAAGAIQLSDGAGDFTSDETVFLWDTVNNKLGIGTDSPDGILHVLTGSKVIAPNTGYDDIVVDSSSGISGMSILSGNTSQGGVVFGDSDSSLQGWLTYNHSDDELRFGAEASTRMALDSTGLHVGGQDPVDAFRVTDNGVDLYVGDFLNNGTDIALATQGDTSAGWYFIRSNGVNTRINAQDASGQILFMIQNNEKARINTAGNLGVGDTSPTTGRLVVNSDADGDTIIDCRSSDNGRFRISSDVSGNAVLHALNSGELHLGSGADDLTIANGGDVTVANGDLTVTTGNTTVTAGDLEVTAGSLGVGVTPSTGLIDTSAATDNSVHFSLKTGANTRLNIGTDAGSDAYIRSQNAQDLHLGVDSTDNITVNSSSEITFAGDIEATQALTYSGIISPSQLTTNRNDYNPTGFSTSSTLRLSSDASRDITGFAAQSSGRTIKIFNIGSNDIVLKDESVSSTAANRLALGADITVSADESVELFYDGTSTRWRAIGGPPPAASGESNTASNVGTGVGVWKQKTGVDLEFKTLTEGDGVELTSNTNDVQIDTVATTPQGRLTVFSGAPLIINDVTAATSVYYTPYLGNKVPIWDGTQFVDRTFTELTLTLNNPNHAANSLYDIYLWDDSGTIRILTGAAWTNTTTRSQTLTRVQGFLVNTGAITGRNGATTYSVGAQEALYIGTFGTTGTAGQTEMSFGGTADGGDPGLFLLWNMYNRRKHTAVVRDSNNSWSITATTWQNFDAGHASGGVNNRVTFVQGLAEDAAHARHFGTVQPGNGDNAYVGIGFNSSSAHSGMTGPVGQGNASHVIFGSSVAGYSTTQLGKHYFQALEITQGGTSCTFYGDANLSMLQSGMIAEVYL